MRMRATVFASVFEPFPRLLLRMDPSNGPSFPVATRDERRRAASVISYFLARDAFCCEREREGGREVVQEISLL